jgi:hypothetical protein
MNFQSALILAPIPHKLPVFRIFQVIAGQIKSRM